MRILIVLAADLVLTVIACGLFGPAASKWAALGLVGWRMRAPFYLLRLYIGPAVQHFAPLGPEGYNPLAMSTVLIMPQTAAKHVVCISWIPILAKTREMLLREAGWRVTSIYSRSSTNQ
jgi:hypothetical protein